MTFLPKTGRGTTKGGGGARASDPNLADNRLCPSTSCAGPPPPVGEE
jgi:hypothetical protein